MGALDAGLASHRRRGSRTGSDQATSGPGPLEVGIRPTATSQASLQTRAGLPVPPVADLCTMGSPLDNPFFRGRSDRPLTRPTSAGDRANVYSRTDVNASALADPYRAVADLTVETSLLPIAAHTACWTHDTVVDLLAGRIAEGEGSAGSQRASSPGVRRAPR